MTIKNKAPIILPLLKLIFISQDTLMLKEAPSNKGGRVFDKYHLDRMARGRHPSTTEMILIISSPIVASQL